MKRVILVFSAIVILVGGILFLTLNNGDDPDEPNETEESTVTSQQTPDLTVSPSPEKIIYSLALPEELSAIVEKNRETAFPQPNPDLTDIIEKYQTPNLDTETDAAIAEILKQLNKGNADKPEYISHEEIIGELDLLFDLLKYGYAAYQYSGGDEVFGAVKELMLAKLARMDDPISNDSYLTDVLVPCLKSVIADNHFWVGGWNGQIGVGNQLYMNDEYVVRKTDDGYITDIDGRKYKVLRAGIEMECLLPTITRDGELAYAFGLMITGGDKFESVGMGADFEDVETGEKLPQVIVTHPVSGKYRNSLSPDMYSLREVEGITVLENRRLFSYESDPQLTEFINTAGIVRDEPVLILDLRCNTGGNDGFAYDWIQRYTGRRPSAVPFARTTLNSMIANVINSSASAGYPPKWETRNYTNPVTIPNDNLVIVLIDNAIASSGESFVGSLRQMQNVVFVGTNTKGCLTTGNVGSTTLPISKQGIGFGVSLNIRPDLSQFEGVGFMPDLWVPPGESLERVIMFVENYKATE